MTRLVPHSHLKNGFQHKNYSFADQIGSFIRVQSYRADFDEVHDVLCPLSFNWFLKKCHLNALNRAISNESRRYSCRITDTMLYSPFFCQLFFHFTKNSFTIFSKKVIVLFFLRNCWFSVDSIFLFQLWRHNAHRIRIRWVDFAVAIFSHMKINWFKKRKKNHHHPVNGRLGLHFVYVWAALFLFISFQFIILFVIVSSVEISLLWRRFYFCLSLFPFSDFELFILEFMQLYFMWSAHVSVLVFAQGSKVALPKHK